MKKFFVMAAVIVAVLLLSNCHSAKKTASKTTAAPTVTAAAVTYHSNIESLVANNCSPCHFPAKGGNKKAFDSYDAVRANIDSMIARVQLNPGDKGFMPFRRAKLSDTTINLFKQWRDSGAPQ
jgi:uncharacterized membrane protein